MVLSLNGRTIPYAELRNIIVIIKTCRMSLKISKISNAKNVNFIPEALMALYVHAPRHTKYLPSWLIQRILCQGARFRDAHNPCATQMPQRITLNIGQVLALVRQEPPCFLSFHFSLQSFTHKPRLHREVRSV